MMMCLRFLYVVAVTVSWFASSWLVGCKVGSHPVPEPKLKPKTEGRQWQRCLRLFADRYKVGKGKVKAIEPGTGQKSLRSRNVYETPFHRNIAMLLRGPR